MICTIVFGGEGELTLMRLCMHNNWFHSACNSWMASRVFKWTTKVEAWRTTVIHSEKICTCTCFSLLFLSLSFIFFYVLLWAHDCPCMHLVLQLQQLSTYYSFLHLVIPFFGPALTLQSVCVETFCNSSKSSCISMEHQIWHRWRTECTYASHTYRCMGAIIYTQCNTFSNNRRQQF